ncbi:MAG TPA: gas vesicle protein GvpG [Gaiellaceae bacterium]|jgi:hypothetical protein
MGLLTGILTLPLAPVRGTVWIAEKLLEQAERDADPDDQLRRRLDDLVVARDLGELTEGEFERAEDDLIAQFDELRLIDSKGGTRNAGDT